jgi:hypothetical protein
MKSGFVVALIAVAAAAVLIMYTGSYNVAASAQADLPDLILCGQVGSGKARIVDVSDIFSGVGGRKFNGRVDSW